MGYDASLKCELPFKLLNQDLPFCFIGQSPDRWNEGGGDECDAANPQDYAEHVNHVCDYQTVLVRHSGVSLSRAEGSTIQYIIAGGFNDVCYLLDQFRCHSQFGECRGQVFHDCVKMEISET